MSEGGVLFTEGVLVIGKMVIGEFVNWLLENWLKFFVVEFEFWAIEFKMKNSLSTEEANISTKILNAKPMFVGQIDGNTELNNKKNDEIAEILKSLKPDVVFTHWPMDTHHDHQIAGLLTLNTWVRMGRKFHLYFYEVNSGDETMAFTPTDYVDISETLERKKKAMFAHKTQNPVETYEKFFKTMEQFRGLEAGAKVAEAFVYFKGKTNIIGL